MSIQAVAAAIEIDNLPPATKLVLILLANRYNGDTGLCCPKQSTLAEEACMTTRSLRTHLKDLEQAGLICRALVKKGHGQPDQTNYSFPFLDRKIFPSEDLDRKNTALRPEKSRDLDRKTVSAHIEQPEGNRKEPEESCFEEAWKLWNSCKLKASAQKKKPAKDAWRVAARKCSPEQLLSAVRQAVELRNKAQGFYPALPHMHRWLQREEWADVETTTEQPATLSREDWKAAMRQFVDEGEWPIPAISPPPTDPACKAPADMLEAWRKHYGQEKAA
jgi:DNA-binding HxlR family transcriptional regulator